MVEAFEIGDESWRVLPEIRAAVAMIAGTAASGTPEKMQGQRIVGSWTDEAARLPSEHEEQPSITCPVCGMTSYNPNDIREGYCGHCHDWTTPR